MDAMEFCLAKQPRGPKNYSGIPTVEDMEEYARLKTAEQDYCSICGKILDGYKGE